MSLEDKEAKKELMRMSGLAFFPSDQSAGKELLESIKSAHSTEIARRAVSDWIAEQREAPKPSEMRRLISGLNQSALEKRKKCPACSGTGSLTAYYRIWYRENSFQIEKREFLFYAPECGGPKDGPEQALALATQITSADETILTAAKRCSCIPERQP